MFRPSRNFKVPLVYGGEWKNSQTFQKWDPISKRLVQVNCCAPPVHQEPIGPCTPPNPVDSVSLYNLTVSGGTVSWVYSGPETFFDISIYGSSSLPVNTSGTPVFYIGGTITSPYSASFTPTNDYYYVAAVRTKNDCNYSSYVYSDPVQFTVNVVGVGSGANTLLYSRDGGITWTGLGNSIFSTAGNCAKWNGTMWVAGGSGTNALAYSYNGINWTGVGEPSTGMSSTFTNCSGLVWTGSFWLGVDGTTQVVKSTDGINWTGYSGVTTLGAAYRIATNGTTIVSIPYYPDGLYMYYTSDGTTWTGVSDANLNSEGIQNYNDIIWDGTRFIIIVGTRASPNNSKFYSTNGTSWTPIPNVSYVDGTNIGKTTGNLYISRGTSPDSTEKSTNGTTWTSATNPSLAIVQGVPGTIFGTDQRVFVCGYSSNSFVYTSDGNTWTSSNTGLSGSFRAGFYKV